VRDTTRILLPNTSPQTHDATTENSRVCQTKKKLININS